VGYSRIYLGVHFPGDILAGWIAGTLLAVVTWLLLKKFIQVNKVA
jgi:undecaprenyl-diphosphatase